MSASQTSTELRNSPPLWATVVATFFGVGRIHPGSGTWGSAATIVLWWFLTRWIPDASQTPAAILLAVLAIAIGIPAATRTAQGAGTEDPGFVVIDEVAGQLITLIAAPVSWKSLVVGFILFRGFDIVKPPPIRSLERLPDGTGIVIDDVGAGLYALVVMQLLLHFGVIK
jgi:phosphatidylglycerophosphatase A